MTKQMIDTYANHLFSELLTNLTGLQQEISKLHINGLDLQASLATVQTAETNGTIKAYWAIHRIAEHLKRPALFYPDADKTWYRDLWFYHTVTQIEPEMKACTTLVMSALEDAVDDDSSFQLAATYWKLLQMLNPNCCRHSEYYLEILYQSPYNWRDHWGVTVARIQHQILQYFLRHEPDGRQQLLRFLPDTHLLREILIRPALSLNDNERVQTPRSPIESNRYKQHIDGLKVKRDILEYLRGLSLNAQYQQANVLKKSLSAYSQTLLAAFSSQFIFVNSRNESDRVSDTEFLFELDTPNKAAFVFDGLCGKDQVYGYEYVKGLIEKEKAFSYIARSNPRYTPFKNELLKQQTYKNDTTIVIDNQLELIQEEIKLLTFYGDIEAKYNNFQAKLNLVLEHIQSLTQILQERRQAIQSQPNMNWTEAQDRYQEHAKYLDLESELELLNMLREDFKKLQLEQASVSYKQKSSDALVTYTHTPFLTEILSACSSTVETLEQDIVNVNRWYAVLTQDNAVIEKAEEALQKTQEKFIMTGYNVHVQIPYLSLIALLASVVIVTLSLGILAGNPMFTFLVVPMLAEYTTVLAALGIAAGLAIGVPSGHNVMRYLLFPLAQENNHSEEVEEISVSCFCN